MKIKQPTPIDQQTPQTPQTPQILQTNEKVTSDHLRRNAYLYLRQSTMKQVFENQESSRRQYALKERAIALGWEPDQIIVIDSDQGQSGKYAQGRDGFKHLVSEVSMGHAGIVIGSEVSRLARNSADWHRLMEICGLTNTLILDEDGLYDSRHINDRLLLGLKGAISEFELHMINSRLWGGKLAKAIRGDLHTPLPVGLVYSPSGEVKLEPNQQVRQSIDLFFSTFNRVGSAMGVVRYFNKNGLKFPRKMQSGPQKGEIVWDVLSHTRARQVLKNPRYAGAYFYGRVRINKFGEGGGGIERKKNVDRSQWYSLIKDSHPGYISWEDYEENLGKLRSNCNYNYNGNVNGNGNGNSNGNGGGGDGAKSSENNPIGFGTGTGTGTGTGIGIGSGPVREGSALLQGLVICGICGKRMTMHYHNRKEGRVPDYVCDGERRFGQKCCQWIGGGVVDQAISELLISSVTPLALEVAINVEKELKSQLQKIDRIRRQEVERVRYEAEQARQRYMNVDPGNRLVAATLEAEWNDKLRQLEQAQQEYERKWQKDRKILKKEEMEKVMTLASDFPRLWKDERVSNRDRKQIVRLLIQDVALKREDGIVKGKEKEKDEDRRDSYPYSYSYSYSISIKIRFRGGVIKSLNIPGPKRVWEKNRTSEKIVNEIDQLLDDQTHSEIADILNKSGLLSLRGRPFTAAIIYNIQRQYGLKSRYERLRENNLLTLEEISTKMQISKVAVKKLEKSNMIKSYNCTDKRKKLYECPDNDFIEKLPEIFKGGAV
jgi:DNA invertase Pin-like site-specific DNA recombinase